MPSPSVASGQDPRMFAPFAAESPSAQLADDAGQIETEEGTEREHHPERSASRSTATAPGVNRPCWRSRPRPRRPTSRTKPPHRSPATPYNPRPPILKQQRRRLRRPRLTTMPPRPNRPRPMPYRMTKHRPSFPPSGRLLTRRMIAILSRPPSFAARPRPSPIGAWPSRGSRTQLIGSCSVG